MAAWSAKVTVLAFYVTASSVDGSALEVVTATSASSNKVLGARIFVLPARVTACSAKMTDLAVRASAISVVTLSVIVTISSASVTVLPVRVTPVPVNVAVVSVIVAVFTGNESVKATALPVKLSGAAKVTVLAVNMTAVAGQVIVLPDGSVTVKWPTF